MWKHDYFVLFPVHPFNKHVALRNTSGTWTLKITQAHNYEIHSVKHLLDLLISWTLCVHFAHWSVAWLLVWVAICLYNMLVLVCDTMWGHYNYHHHHHTGMEERRERESSFLQNHRVECGYWQKCSLHICNCNTLLNKE